MKKERALRSVTPIANVTGLEAEFVLHVDDVPVTPEEFFEDPRCLFTEATIPRRGKALALPTAGALYFDKGVVEVATPLIRIGPGAGIEAAHSLWRQIDTLTRTCDRYERANGQKLRLSGFSMHYNYSFDRSGWTPTRTLDQLSNCLCGLLFLPAILFGTHRGSTGVGFRPRVTRAELTLDFCPDPQLVSSLWTIVAAVFSETAKHPKYDLVDRPDLRRLLPKNLPIGPHRSRNGWLVRREFFEINPFELPADAKVWEVEGATSQRSTVEVVRTLVDHFGEALERVSDDATNRTIRDVLNGSYPLPRDGEHPPEGYVNIRRRKPLPPRLPNDALHRAMQNVVDRRAVRVDGRWFVPTLVSGWNEVRLASTTSGACITQTIEFLAECEWASRGAQPLSHRAAHPGASTDHNMRSDCKVLLNS